MKLNKSAFRLMGFGLIFTIIISSVVYAQMEQQLQGIQKPLKAPLTKQGINNLKPFSPQFLQGHLFKKQPKPLSKNLIPFSNTLQPGVNYFSHGEIGKANRYFENEVEKADTPSLKIKTKIIWANSLSRASKIQKNDKGLMKQAEQKYLTLLPEVKGDLRLNTYNNYGALLLRQNRPKEALSILKKVEENS